MVILQQYVLLGNHNLGWDVQGSTLLLNYGQEYWHLLSHILGEMNTNYIWWERLDYSRRAKGDWVNVNTQQTQYIL